MEFGTIWHMNTIFTKIINREIPAQFVYEDNVCVVIMDKFPVVTGQVLIIPKVEVDYFFNLDDTTSQHLFDMMKKITKALDTTYRTLRTCVVIEGFEVPHAHIKLYPLTTHGFNMHGGKEADDATLAKEAVNIRANLS